MTGKTASGWRVLTQETVLQHPFVTVAMEQVRLPKGNIIADWPKVYTNDYVNVAVFDKAKRVLIVEGYKHGIGRLCWQIVGGYLDIGEDPLTAVKRELREETGYESDEWIYLGGYTVDANRHIGISHSFCALNAEQVVAPYHDDLEAFTLKWVPLSVLVTALQDGRVAVVGHALTISLALLTLQNRPSVAQHVPGWPQL